MCTRTPIYLVLFSLLVFGLGEGVIDIPDSDLVYIILNKSIEVLKKSLESHKY